MHLLLYEIATGQLYPTILMIYLQALSELFRVLPQLSLFSVLKYAYEIYSDSIKKIALKFIILNECLIY